jgi:cytochrome c oxidase assembly protein Cox11
VSGIAGATVDASNTKRVSDTAVAVGIEFNGDIDVDANLTFSVGKDAIANYNGPALAVQLPVTASTEAVVASTSFPLTEPRLNGSVITLTLAGRVYAPVWDIRDAVKVSGIAGITIPRHQTDRRSVNEVTVKLEFNGNIDADATLTFSVGADAITGYSGLALTAQLPVTASVESVTASTTSPLTEASLDGSVVTLTLSGCAFARSIFDIRDAVTVAGIDGATMPWHQPDRQSDTKVTIELEFDGDMEADGSLTFTVGADAIANYNGPALTAQLPVTASKEDMLAANFPNPFNPETWIPYQLATDAVVTLTIHALDGQLVRRLGLGYQPAGTYYSRSRAAYWDGKNDFGEQVASGVYFYTLTARDFTATRKMLIRK